MEDIRIYICPECGNIALNEGEVSKCCGKPLEHPLEASEVREGDEHYLTLEQVEDQWYVSSKHLMTKEHFLSYAVLISEGELAVKKSYSEWDFSWRVPIQRSRRLYNYCTKHGLHYQEIF